MIIYIYIHLYIILPSSISKRRGNYSSVLPDISISTPVCPGGADLQPTAEAAQLSACWRVKMSCLAAEPEQLFSAPLKGNEDASVSIPGCLGRCIVEVDFLMCSLYANWRCPKNAESPHDVCCTLPSLLR